MIQIINGDLLAAFRVGEVNVIGHCANMQNTFGSGIAASIRKHFPGAFEADTCWHKRGDRTRVLYSIGGGGIVGGTIFNLYGQVHYGRDKRYLHYRLLAKALNQMGSLCVAHDVVGFPYKMGCGSAGGDWEIVQELIAGAFPHCQVRIYRLEGT